MSTEMTKEVGKMLVPEGTELEEVMAKNKNWPYPAHLDGWYLIHVAIRVDMENIKTAVGQTLAQLKDSKPLSAWQVRYWQKYFANFYDIVHMHHENEEEIMFPFIATKVQLPPKMSADHQTLTATLVKCRALVQGLREGGALADDTATFQQLKDSFESLMTLMAEHLDEEEEVGLPLLRKHFTMHEFKPTEKKIVARVTPHEVGYVMHAMADDAARRSWMTDVAGMPGFVQSLIMMPALHKWTREWQPMIESLKTGIYQPPQKSGCLCFS